MLGSACRHLGLVHGTAHDFDGPGGDTQAIQTDPGTTAVPLSWIVTAYLLAKALEMLVGREPIGPTNPDRFRVGSRSVFISPAPCIGDVAFSLFRGRLRLTACRRQRFVETSHA